MMVALVLLYVVAALFVVSFIGMGIMAFLDWRRDFSLRKSREKRRKEINDAIAFNRKNGTYDLLEHYSDKIDLE